MFLHSVSFVAFNISTAPQLSVIPLLLWLTAYTSHRLFNTPTAPLLFCFSHKMNNFQNNKAPRVCLLLVKDDYFLTLKGQECVTIK